MHAAVTECVRCSWSAAIFELAITSAGNRRHRQSGSRASRAESTAVIGQRSRTAPSQSPTGPQSVFPGDHRGTGLESAGLPGQRARVADGAAGPAIWVMLRWTGGEAAPLQFWRHPPGLIDPHAPIRPRCLECRTHPKPRPHRLY